MFAGSPAVLSSFAWLQPNPSLKNSRMTAKSDLSLRAIAFPPSVGDNLLLYRLPQHRFPRQGPAIPRSRRPKLTALGVVPAKLRSMGLPCLAHMLSFQVHPRRDLDELVPPLSSRLPAGTARRHCPHRCRAGSGSG